MFRVITLMFICDYGAVYGAHIPWRSYGPKTGPFLRFLWIFKQPHFLDFWGFWGARDPFFWHGAGPGIQNGGPNPWFGEFSVPKPQISYFLQFFVTRISAVDTCDIEGCQLWTMSRVWTVWTMSRVWTVWTMSTLLTLSTVDILGLRA